MESDYIEWAKSRNKDGYGRRKFRGQSMGAHRAAWIETNGAIPGGLVVRHKCDNRACVNIDHLELGTQAENMMDCSVRRTFNSKLTEDDVKDIRTSSETLKFMAEKYSVSETTISRIRNHKRWK